MTVIAWDGKTLAADRMSCRGTTPVVVTGSKIWRGLDGSLLAAAGDRANIMLYRWWLENPEEPMPTFSEERYTILCITSSREVWVRHEKMAWTQLESPFWAIGYGTDYALGAMAAGASAEQAVLITSSLDINCGLGVDTLTL